MKYIQRRLDPNRIIYRKYAKNYRYNMNIIIFLKSNYKYKRRTTRCHVSRRQQSKWHLPDLQQKHKLPANRETMTEDKQFTKRIPFYESIKLDNFLREFILIMQQATQKNKNSNNNNNNHFNCSKSQSTSSRLATRLVAKININNANKSLANEDQDGIGENHRAYKDANKDTAVNVDISNIAVEISHQQHNYDKVSTITSTPIKCQRRKHHQISATNSLLSSSPTPTQSSSFSLMTTTSTMTMTTVLSSPSIEHYETCQWSAILRHYVRGNSSIHQHQYHHKSKHTHYYRQHHQALNKNSLTSSRVLHIDNNSSSRSNNDSATSMRTRIYQSVDQYVNATWNRSYTLSCLLLTLFIAFGIGVRSTTAGACWQTMLNNGKCNEIFSLNISKSECCGANQEFAYTEREPTNVEYFFATAIGGGMECSPCLESCRNVKCGPNKKCVKRRGRPKCVCAPECGPARRRRKHREHLMQQEQQPQHHTIHLDNGPIIEDDIDEDGGYFSDVPSAVRSSNTFNVKIEKSQQSRDTRSLSSEITNVNLGLGNGKDAMIGSGATSQVERHHCKEHNQNQRKLLHVHIHHSNEHGQHYTHQQKHKNQEPRSSRRLLITANVEHMEKPTTRRLQIFSNVRTTHARRQNINNSNKSRNGQHEDADSSDYDKENDKGYNYNDAEDDAKKAKKKNSSNISNGNRKNHRNDDSKRFLNQSSSRHKPKTNTKPNNNNNNNNSNINSNNNTKNRNKNHHNLQTTKIQKHSSNNNNTRAKHPQLNGRHAENTPHNRHHSHNHHNHQRHQLLQQQQQEQHHNNYRQQSQNNRRHKHNNSNKKPHKQQQSIVLKKPKNNKDYNITTTTTSTSIAVVTTATTARHINPYNSDTDTTAVDASSTVFPQTRMVKIAAATSLNLSSPSAVNPTTQSQLLLLSSSAKSSFSSATPVNSTMSADDDAAADDYYHSHLPNHGSKIATSSLLSATSNSSSLSLSTALASSPSPSSTYSQLSAEVSARSSSESSDVTMSAKGEGVSLHDHKHHNEIPTKTAYNNYNKDNIISVLQSNLHNNQQQDQQQQTQPQSQHHFQTPLFDGISEQFDLIGFSSNKQQQRVTNGDNVRPLNPVCGTDGRTYNTECQLRKRACRTDNPNLQIAYRGHCRTTCNGVKCLNGLTCVEDQYSMPHCIACRIECPQDDYDNDVVDATRAVCGADGKTYKSACDINRMICKIGRSIGVAYPGPCRGYVLVIKNFHNEDGDDQGNRIYAEDQVTCDDINCGPKQVCLIDLLTHKPRCTSCRYKCSRKRRPSSPHFEEGKICGFNNRTYNSWCEMRKDSCSTGFYIDVKYSGDCH